MGIYSAADRTPWACVTFLGPQTAKVMDGEWDVQCVNAQTVDANLRNHGRESERNKCGLNASTRKVPIVAESCDALAGRSHCRNGREKYPPGTFASVQATLAAARSSTDSRDTRGTPRKSCEHPVLSDRPLDGGKPSTDANQSRSFKTHKAHSA